MKKIAPITGITGQDGSYLAELLLSKNYIESLLKDGDSVKILDTKYKEQSNSKIRVTTEYKVIRNSKKKTIRMRLIADFDREKNIMIQVVFHNQI